MRITELVDTINDIIFEGFAVGLSCGTEGKARKMKPKQRQNISSKNLSKHTFTNYTKLNRLSNIILIFREIEHQQKEPIVYKRSHKHDQ